MILSSDQLKVNIVEPGYFPNTTWGCGSHNEHYFYGYTGIFVCFTWGSREIGLSENRGGITHTSYASPIRNFL